MTDVIFSALHHLVREDGPFACALAQTPDASRAIARALGGRHVQVPLPALRRLADLSWRAHLQQVDVGWLDMAYQAPLLDSTRARVELGWSPEHSSAAVLAAVIDGMRCAAYDETPVLRRRRVRDGVLRALRGEPVAHRHEP